MLKFKFFSLFLGIILFWRCESFADPGHVIIELPGLIEKQVDSVKVWLDPNKNIIQSGICLENKLLLVRVEVMNSQQLEAIFQILKENGIADFYIKEEIAIDRFLQHCSTFISFQ